MSWRVLLAVAVACLATSASFARDDGRYAGSPLKPWFDELRDKNGQQCCADADGAVVKDVDWTAGETGKCRRTPALSFNEEDAAGYEGRYCARYKGELIWPVCRSSSHVAGADACKDADSVLYFIRCFIPGAGA